LILDEAEDAGWIERNVARGLRTRERAERRTSDVLEASEFLALLSAADELDRRYAPPTVARATQVRALRDEHGIAWKEIAARVGVAPSTAFYLYGCETDSDSRAGPRRAIIAALGLTGLRVGELCALDRQHLDLKNAKIYVRDSKTSAGVRAIDIRARLLNDLRGYAPTCNGHEITDPLFQTLTGRRRDRNNVLRRVIGPAATRAMQFVPSAATGPSTRTSRRTRSGGPNITFMLAAGFDLPYVQDQVGHRHPSTTLAIYAKVIRRPDRDVLRAEMRSLLGEAAER
jgi:integrase